MTSLIEISLLGTSAALMASTASPMPNVPSLLSLLEEQQQAVPQPPISPQRSPTFPSAISPAPSPDLSSSSQYTSPLFSPLTSANASPARSNSIASLLSAPSLDTRLPRRDTVFVNGS